MKEELREEGHLSYNTEELSDARFAHGIENTTLDTNDANASSAVQPETKPEKTPEKRYRPFSNGSQASDWSEHNCSNCLRYNPDYIPGENKGCDLEFRIFVLEEECVDWDYVGGDGTVNEETARRMGYLKVKESDNPTAYGWPCGELDPIPGFAESIGYANLAEMMEDLGRPLQPKPLEPGQIPLPYDAYPEG